MIKFFLHLFVAVTCFALSVSLTSLTKLFHVADIPVEVVAGPLVLPKEYMSDDEIEIRDIYREYGPAQTRHDRGFFERIETEDFRLFCADESISREADIRWMESMPRDIVYENQPYEITIFGDSAVARTWFQSRSAEGSVQRWDTIDIWTKRRGRWQIRSTTQNY